MNEITKERIQELIAADKDGRCVILPCQVGDTVYVVGICDRVFMRRDDDYFLGTGATECPFENSCEFEDCCDDNKRIFETTVEDFWYGNENGSHEEAFLKNIAGGFILEDFGKTVFLTREEAEAALEKESENER